MRAIFLPQENFSETYVFEDEIFHHLVNVVRIQTGDELLILNGYGLKVLAKVQEILKKKLIVSIESKELVKRKFQLDLALGIPKKEALELALKQATEIGFRRIYLVESEYSNLRNVEVSRLKKVLVSALEQSNSAFMPELINQNWNEIPYADYESNLLLDSKGSRYDRFQFNTVASQLLVIGPEGGFSSREIDFFLGIKNIKSLHLPTGILRSPTAVAVGAGWILKGLMN